MSNQIRIAILGYGNLGRGVELAVRANPDMTLTAFFTRRAPESLKTLTPDVPVYHVDRLLEMKDAIDAPYVVADGVSFANKYMRRDIGQRALAAKN